MGSNEVVNFLGWLIPPVSRFGWVRDGLVSDLLHFPSCHSLIRFLLTHVSRRNVCAVQINVGNDKLVLSLDGFASEPRIRGQRAINVQAVSVEVTAQWHKRSVTKLQGGNVLRVRSCAIDDKQGAAIVTSDVREANPSGGAPINLGRQHLVALTAVAEVDVCYELLPIVRVLLSAAQRKVDAIRLPVAIQVPGSCSQVVGYAE
jgi:hypothetical protein